MPSVLTAHFIVIVIVISAHVIVIAITAHHIVIVITAHVLKSQVRSTRFPASVTGLQLMPGGREVIIIIIIVVTITIIIIITH